MKILICVQEYYPSGSGIANVAYYVAKELEKLGHTCDVISTGGDAKVITNEFIINKVAGFGLFYFWNKVRSYIKQNEGSYDVIWVHNPLFLKKINSSKIYSTIHTTYVKYFGLYSKLNYSIFVKIYYYLMTYLERICYRKNDLKCSSVVSSEVKKELLALGVTGKIKYLRNGVDTKKFKPLKVIKNSFNFPKGKKIFLCVGRVSYQKNPYGMIEYMVSLNKKDEDIHFCWAGNGDLLEEVKEYVKKNNYSCIQMLGKVPHEELVNLYSLADFYVLLSFYEGQPLTLLEALSCGLIPLVSDIGNLKEVVDSIGYGICVDYKNPKDVDRAIDYFKTNNTSKVKKHIRTVMLKHYDWTTITQEYLEEFNQIAN